MLDLIIRGGDVVTPQGVVQGDVAIAGETIAAVPRRVRWRRQSARRVIDATATSSCPAASIRTCTCITSWIKPDGTPLVTAGPEQVGRAALFGGTTTFIDFAYWRGRRVSARRRSRRATSDFVGKSPCDWAYHLMLHSEPPPAFAGQLAEAIQAGYPTLKIFTTNILPTRTGRMIDFGDIWEAFQVLAKEGGLGVIHAEDNDIVMHMYAKLIREGRVGFENLAEVHNQLSEDLSFRRILRLAESVPGTALYMMHVSAATGVAAIARGARQGPADLRRDAAPVPALHGRGLQAAQRPDLSHLSVAQVGGRPEGAVGRHRATASIHCIATDELCCTLKDKTIGNRIDDTTGGNSGVEPRLGVMYTEMVVRRGYSLLALCRSRLDQCGQDHGALSDEGRDRGRQRRRHRHPRSDPARQGDARPICTRPTTRRGRATTSSPGR